MMQLILMKKIGIGFFSGTRFLIFDQALNLPEALSVERHDEFVCDINGVRGVSTFDDGELMSYLSPAEEIPWELTLFNLSLIWFRSSNPSFSI